MTGRYYILLFLFFVTGRLFADNVRISASASKSQVATGEEFEITYTVNGNAEQFNPPDFNGFQVVSGPNQSSSMTSINGNVTASTSVSYGLIAVKVGSFTIGPATIVAGGRKLISNAVHITVVKGRPVSGNTGSNVVPGREEPVTASSSDLSKLLFIRAAVSKSRVYVGEQITVDYKLYTQVDILNSDVDKIPDLNGFWSEDIKNQGQNVQWRTEVYKGARYNVADIKQTILFPQRAGQLMVDPLAMTFVVRQPRPPRDIMEQVFGAYREVKYKVKSLPVSVRVDQLPDAGKPAGFTGAVGSFSVQASVDKKELRANDALNYTFKISGSGNLKLLNDPGISFPPVFEKYDPKIADNISETADGVSGNRSYTYLLIPRHEGTYSIAPVRFSWFNPATKKYNTIATSSFDIKVEKGAGSGGVTAFSPGDRQDVRMLNRDIRYIKRENPDFYKKGEGFYGSVWYYLLLLAGPLLFLAAFLWRKRIERDNSDEVKVRNRKAGKLVNSQMASAAKQLETGNATAFYEELAKGIYGYLSIKLDIPAARLNNENIVSGLQSRKVDGDIILRLTDTLSLCEMARFAPVSGISKEEVFEKTKAIIHDIESKI